MDIAKLRRLIRLIERSDVAEIEITEGDTTIRITRTPPATGAASAPASPPPQPAAQPSAAPAAEAVPEPEPAGADEAEPPEEHVVRAPMVGTFYRAPSPDAEPFVQEGQRVKKGDVLCIIEAMKLMNEIEAEYDGVVEKILVENAQPVEYGQPLFVIRPL